jgi:hypothetical protein
MNTSEKLNFVLTFTKYSTQLIHFWPTTPNISRIWKIVLEIFWILTFFNSTYLLIALLVSIYTYRENFEIMTKSICLSCAVSQLTIKKIVCKLRSNKLKVCISIFCT